MPMPTVPVDTTDADAGTDDPSQFRADALDLIQKFNDLIAMYGIADGFASLDAGALVPVNQLPAATASAKGVAEKATQTETDAGTDPDRFITPETLSGFTLQASSGTWTPTIEDGSTESSDGQVYSANFGNYTKIGDRVFITGRVAISDLGTLVTTAGAYLGGLPFTSNSTSGRDGSIHMGRGSSLAIPAGYTISGSGVASKTVMQLQLWDLAGGTTPLLISELSVGGGFWFSGHYIT